MTGAPRPGRVLIVDDEPGLLRASERVLAGHELRLASRPGEALALAPEFRPDLAILDVRMPEMDGFALADALRERCPGLDVIFMTGSHSEPDANLVRAVRSKAFYFIQKPFDRQVLLTLVERCFELRRLREADRAHTQRLERELADARTFQTAMLAPAHGRVGELSVEARWRPSQELGGDMYDYAPAVAGGEWLAFILADVSGHGAAAALLTGVVKSAFRAEPGPGFDPSRAVHRLAAALRPFGDERFVTCLCGVIDPAQGLLRYVSAGHPAACLLDPPSLAAPGGARALGASAGLVCTAFDDQEWQTLSTAFPTGTTLLACTDGLADAAGVAMHQTASLLAQAAGTSARERADSLLARAHARLGGRPAPDDITVLVVGPREQPRS